MPIRIREGEGESSHGRGSLGKSGFFVLIVFMIWFGNYMGRGGVRGAVGNE